MLHKIFRAVGAVLAMGVLSGFGTAPAAAQNARSFVSGHGSDSNTCALAAPCRSFAYAITQTAAGGEITVLDSAGYGAVTIGQSVTISNPGGVEAGVTAAAGNDAITIDAAGAANVTLRGLTLEGGGIGQNGVHVMSTGGGTVNILDCVITGFSADGILVAPTGSTSTALAATLRNVVLLDNAGAGLSLSPTTASSNLYLSGENITSNGNGTGLYLNVTSITSGLIDHLFAVGNTSYGVQTAGGGFNWGLTLSNSTIALNQSRDIYQGNTATGPAGLSLYDHNKIGSILFATGAPIFTDGSNDIAVVTSGNLTAKATQ